MGTQLVRISSLASFDTHSAVSTPCGILQSTACVIFGRSGGGANIVDGDDGSTEGERLVSVCNSLPFLSVMSCDVTRLMIVKVKLSSHVASSFHYKELYLGQNILEGKPKPILCMNPHHQQPGIVYTR